MMTVITHVTLKQGAEPEWDEAMHKRLEAARDEEGWVGGQLQIPLDALNQRTIIGTWTTRAEWERWHSEKAFAETRRHLEGLEAAPRETRWYECVLDVRR